MDLTTFRELQTPQGQAALADAAALAPTDAGFLQAFEKLRKRHPVELARAALDTVLLRERARPRHSLADRLYFTREALEQSSSEAVSRYRASRFSAFSSVLDLCCGVGMDAISLAAAGCRVEGVDNDPLRLAMAEANAVAAGQSIRFHEGDVQTMPLPKADAAFLDPSRRSGARRHLAPREYQPPVDQVVARFPAGFPIGVKIAPGVARHDLEPFAAEAEFISSDGELKECVLWFGSLKSARTRATVLSPSGPATLASDDSPPEPIAEPLGDFLFDPDSSVIRAGLLGLLAEQLEAAATEFGIALLTGSKIVGTPFAHAYRVEASLPLRPEKIREYLREHGIGRVTMLKRAIEVDVNELHRKLKLDSSEHRHLILTRIEGKQAAIVAIRADSSDYAGGEAT